MKKILFFILISLQAVLAQDPQFTQFFAAPVYHNPAFTGSANAPRIMLNYRNQWPSLNANYITSVVTIDHFVEKANSGIGLTFLEDSQGYKLKTTEVSGVYAYQLQLNENNFVRAGLQASYTQKGIDPSGLIFGDQLGPNGFLGTSTADPFGSVNLRNVSLFDVGSGLLYYNPKSFFGISVAHITQPKIDFIPSSQPNSIYRKFTASAGTRIDLQKGRTQSLSMDREFSLSPAVLYKKQGSFSQLDMGAYLTYTPLTVGLWYRGIPLKGVVTKFPNQDAIAALVGFRFDNFSIGYSYDLTISGLGSSSGGSHEFSISYQLDKRDSDRTPYQRQRKKELACPKF
jgi:type IX secretion system PorP/SprF family membrane protein